jgi:hypothetical protein
LRIAAVFDVTWLWTHTVSYLMLTPGCVIALTNERSTDLISLIPLLALFLSHLADSVSFSARHEVSQHHLLSLHSMYRHSKRCMSVHRSRILWRRYWINYYLIKAQIKTENKMNVWAFGWSLPEPIGLQLYTTMDKSLIWNIGVHKSD